MNQERREKAIAWLTEEIRSLELAPQLNGCPMTPEWSAQLEIMRTCLEAVRGHGYEPLTLEQLREMDGKPAYWMEDDSWGIISVDSAGPWAGIPFFRGRKFEVNFEYDIESRGMDVYADQPAHIDRDAWEPCGECAPNCWNCVDSDADEDTYPMTCQCCVNHNNYRPRFKFCSGCGRPLTEEALAELEKRIRG